MTCLDGKCYVTCFHNIFNWHYIWKIIIYIISLSLCVLCVCLIINTCNNACWSAWGKRSLFSQAPLARVRRKIYTGIKFEKCATLTCGRVCTWAPQGRGVGILDRDLYAVGACVCVYWEAEFNSSRRVGSAEDRCVKQRFSMSSQRVPRVKELGTWLWTRKAEL